MDLVRRVDVLIEAADRWSTGGWREGGYAEDAERLRKWKRERLEVVDAELNRYITLNTNQPRQRTTTKPDTSGGGGGYSAARCSRRCERIGGPCWTGSVVGWALFRFAWRRDGC